VFHGCSSMQESGRIDQRFPKCLILLSECVASMQEERRVKIDTNRHKRPTSKSLISLDFLNHLESTDPLPFNTRRADILQT
jgi:hypothetical protein